MKIFNIFCVHGKILFLGGFTKNQYIGGDYLKEGFGQFGDLRGGGGGTWQKRGGGGKFLRGGLIPQCTQ